MVLVIKRDTQAWELLILYHLVDQNLHPIMGHWFVDDETPESAFQIFQIQRQHILI